MFDETANGNTMTANSPLHDIALGAKEKLPVSVDPNVTDPNALVARPFNKRWYWFLWDSFGKPPAG